MAAGGQVCSHLLPAECWRQREETVVTRRKTRIMRMAASTSYSAPPVSRWPPVAAGSSPTHGDRDSAPLPAHGPLGR